MARRNYNQDDMKGVIGGIQKLNKWKNRFVTGLVFAACGAVIIFLIVLMLGTRTEEIIDKYKNLSGAPHDSKQQFAMRNVIITYDDNGKMSIQIVQGNNGNNAGVGGVGDSDPGTPDSDGDVGGGDGGDNEPDIPGPKTGTPLNPNDVEKAVYQFLKGLGYADTEIAGIMGNMKAESGTSPGTTQSHTHDYTDKPCVTHCVGSSGNAHGLVQWDGGRLDNLLLSAQSTGVDWWDLDFQLNFYKSEIEGSEKNNAAPGKLLAAANGYNFDEVEYATYQFARYYERCAGTTGTKWNTRGNISHWNERHQYAADYYATITSGGF